MSDEQQIKSSVKAKVKKNIKIAKTNCNGVRKSEKWKNLLGVIVVLAMGMAAVWAWQDYGLKVKANGTKESLLNQEKNEELSAEQLLLKVGRLIALPSTETPTIASVVDAEKLKNEQAFYRDVQNEDIILIYPQAQKAFIYRPSMDILVNVGPIYMNNTLNAPLEESNIPVEPITVELRNGVNKAGLAAALRDELSTDEAYNVIKIGDANNKNYTNYVLVDLGLADNQKSILTNLEIKYGVKAVTELPSGEASSNAQLLIIIGQ